MYFLSFRCCWYPALILHGQIKHRVWLQFSFICWDPLCVLLCGWFLEKVPWDAEKNMYYLVFGCNWHSIRSVSYIWYLMTFNSKVSLFSFFSFLDDLHIDEIKILKLPFPLCLGQYVTIDLKVFLLWNWVSLCLLCIDLRL